MLEEIASETWATRSEYWKSETNKSVTTRPKRTRRNAPMILCGHGVSLKVQNGALFIQDGAAHVDSEPSSYRFYPGELDIPERIIIVESSGAITLAALRWLGGQSVTLIDIDWQGRAVSVIGASGVVIEPDKYLEQIEIRRCPKKRLAFSANLIRQKFINSIETLEAVFDPSPKRDKAIEFTQKSIERIDEGRPKDVRELLGVEGGQAASYFRAWTGLELNWKDTKRYPVPTPWKTYFKRSSELTGKYPYNYRADHPINAMLNYGYAVLESQLRLKIVSEGYDPLAGIYHDRNKTSPGYILDMMEPDRPRIDRTVIEFALSRKFSVKDFYIRKDGVCRLGPELARALVRVVMSGVY